jgi:hypothetical protein
MTTIERFKDRHDLTPGEELEFQRTRRLPESAEYLERRAEVLADAGLEDADSGEKPLGEMTPEDHLQRIQGNG